MKIKLKIGNESFITRLKDTAPLIRDLVHKKFSYPAFMTEYDILPDLCIGDLDLDPTKIRDTETKQQWKAESERIYGSVGEFLPRMEYDAIAHKWAGNITKENLIRDYARVFNSTTEEEEAIARDFSIIIADNIGYEKDKLERSSRGIERLLYKMSLYYRLIYEEGIQVSINWLTGLHRHGFSWKMGSKIDVANPRKGNIVTFEEWLDTLYMARSIIRSRLKNMSTVYPQHMLGVDNRRTIDRLRTMADSIEAGLQEKGEL